MTREAAGSTPARSDRSDRLYGIGRADLAPGLRAAQIGHALIHWTVENGDPPPNLVLLEVPGEAALWRLSQIVKEHRPAAFFEPDLEDQLTAIAVHGAAWKHLSEIGLAFRK